MNDLISAPLLCLVHILNIEAVPYSFQVQLDAVQLLVSKGTAIIIQYYLNIISRLNFPTDTQSISNQLEIQFNDLLSRRASFSSAETDLTNLKMDINLYWSKKYSSS